MSAKFYAVGSFHLPSRNLFVIVGDVLEGSVRPGMTFAVQLNPGFAVTSNANAGARCQYTGGIQGSC
jgi:hypothetical protein